MKLSLSVAALLLLLYAALIAALPPVREPRFQSQEQHNRHIVEGYLADPGALPVVYVGSSMAARLASGTGGSCAYDLALHGESSLSGLSVVRAAKVRPRVVLVETNVPERAANQALIDKADAWLPRHLALFATANRPVNLLLGRLNQWRAQKPAGVDPRNLATGLEVQRASYAQRIDATVLARNMHAMKEDVDALERDGVRVFLFELPIHPALEDMPRARQIREAYAATFPDRRMISSRDLARDLSVQTVDGVHLAPDEAAAVAQRLVTLHRDVCAAPPAA